MVGSSTKTFCIRLAKAGSFSMYLRYSFKVVAPIQCKSPLASIGLRMLAASREESPPAPAPIKVWISSIKRMILPSEELTSFMTAFNLSSNSPRYFAPAIREPTSSSKMVLFFKVSGTSPLKILQAKPSTTAVLPTPGSPINTGLFLLFRDRISITLLISSSLPMIGSILPLATLATKSRPYFFKASYWTSGLSLVTWELPLICLMHFSKVFLS